MIGRRGPLERIGRLFDEARDRRAGALVIRGEAGIGKTALLHEVETRAEGFQRLRARGIESEAALDHAGLLQLLGPLRAHLDEVPERQRRAVEAALGWGPPAQTDDHFLVAAGTLSLLAAAAAHTPVLVVVDDLHWLDPATAAAVLFAARRLAHDAVVILLGTRHDAPAGTALDGIEALDLVGLGPDEAAGLFPTGTAPAVVAQLVAATQGNPLALIETAGRLTVAQRRGAAGLPDLIPASGRLDGVFEPLVTALSAGARLAVVLAAARRDDMAAPLLAALQAQNVEPEGVLEEAEQRGLLVRGPGVVRFRHPLLRTVTWAMATPSERRAAHTALGSVMGTDRRRDRVWHLAEAATAPDGALAAELEALASEDRDRYGHAAASASFERAARISDDPSAAAERLVAAVEHAALAGDGTRARQLVDRLLAGDVERVVRGRALGALGILEQCTGSIPRAADLLSQAADDTDGALRVRVLAELAMVCHRLGDYAGLGDVAARIARTADGTDPHQRFLAGYFDGFAALSNGDHDRGRSLLLEAFKLYESDSTVRDDPRHLTLATLAIGWLGLSPEIADFLEGRLAHARARGALSVLVPTLAMFAFGRAWMFGDHVTAFANAGEAVELGTELGFVVDVAPALEVLAWQHAVRGFHDEASAELERSAVLIEQAGTTAVAAHLALARAFAALCRDDFAEVVRLLEPRFEIDDGRGSMGEPLGIAPPLIEAYVALGRDDDARALTQRFAAVPEPDEPTQALIARSQGLSATDPTEAVAAFEAAIAAHVASNDAPFELARTELLLGSRLRRDGQRAAARSHLRSARERFTAMDLTLWVQRSKAELAATGETVRSRRRTSDEPLTSQETRVAILVAKGLTNREVAAALFVSPKTIEYHLSNVYRKRGLRSRSELVRAMAASPASD